MHRCYYLSSSELGSSRRIKNHQRAKNIKIQTTESFHWAFLLLSVSRFSIKPKKLLFLRSSYSPPKWFLPSSFSAAWITSNAEGTTDYSIAWKHINVVCTNVTTKEWIEFKNDVFFQTLKFLIQNDPCIKTKNILYPKRIKFPSSLKLMTFTLVFHLARVEGKLLW